MQALCDSLVLERQLSKPVVLQQEPVRWAVREVEVLHRPPVLRGLHPCAGASASTSGRTGTCEAGESACARHALELQLYRTLTGGSTGAADVAAGGGAAAADCSACISL